MSQQTVSKAQAEATRKLLDKLLTSLATTNPNHNPLQVTAQLDAAELLLDHVGAANDIAFMNKATADVKSALEDIIAGNRGAYMQHIVRAVGILLNRGLV